MVKFQIEIYDMLMQNLSNIFDYVRTEDISPNSCHYFEAKNEYYAMTEAWTPALGVI